MATSSFTQLLRKIRIALTPSFCNLTSRLQNGTLISGRNKAGYGSRGVYLMRDDYEPELRHLHRLLSVGGVLMDIGANSGVYSMQAGRIVGPKGLIIALEPSPVMIGTLWDNVGRNGYNHVRIRQLCVSDKLGEMTFWMNRGLPNSFSINRFDETSRCFSVLSVTVDDIVAWEAIPQLDYIKIDAEGAEPSILRGAVRTIATFQPVIQVENTLAETVCPPGYRIFQLAGSPNLLLVPAGHHAIPWLQQNALERHAPSA